MNIPASAAAEIATKYDMELALIVGYDGLTLEVASFGRRPMGKDMAADWADQIPTLLGFDSGTKRINEDFRATPAAEYKRKLDIALVALKEVRNQVASAVLIDDEKMVPLHDFWEMQQIARAAIAELGG